MEENTPVDYAKALREAYESLESEKGSGTCANYIPALARVSPQNFGMAVFNIDGTTDVAGDGGAPFSVQSISKVFSLTLAMRLIGESVWKRIGYEPSGDPFNSLVQLEFEQGVPRNPFINAGAICVADRIVSEVSDAKGALLELVSGLVGEPVAFDQEVAASEEASGYRNRAVANFMKSFGTIDNDVDEVLDFYFHQCSLALSCLQLAKACSFLANDGVCPHTGRRILQKNQAGRVKALMLMCGLYDAAGKFAVTVGIPAKSGVGGGVIGVVPGHLAVCAWSPGLDKTGNSQLGVKAIGRFAELGGLSIF